MIVIGISVRIGVPNFVKIATLLNFIQRLQCCALRHHTKFYCHSLNDYDNRGLKFLKLLLSAILNFLNFNFKLLIWHRMALWSRAKFKLKRLRAYSNFKFFKMAAVRHLEFVKIQIFNFCWVRTGAVHHRAKFRRDSFNSCEDTAILSF